MEAKKRAWDRGWFSLFTLIQLVSAFKCLHCTQSFQIFAFSMEGRRKTKTKKTDECGQDFIFKEIWLSLWWVTWASCYTGGRGALSFPPPPPPPATGGSKLKEIRVLYLQQGRLQLLDCTVCPTYLTSLHPECVAHSVDKSRHIYTNAFLEVG